MPPHIPVRDDFLGANKEDFFLVLVVIVRM